MKEKVTKPPGKRRVRGSRPPQDTPASAEVVEQALDAPTSTSTANHSSGEKFNPNWPTNRKVAWLKAQLQDAQSPAETRESIKITNGADGNQTPDALDQVQLAQDREIAIRTADKNSKKRRLIAAAIKRLQEESYGICLDCENSIATKRLEALPWAECCIQCATSREQSEPLDDEAQPDIAA